VSAYISDVLVMDFLFEMEVVVGPRDSTQTVTIESIVRAKHLVNTTQKKATTMAQARRNSGKTNQAQNLKSLGEQGQSEAASTLRPYLPTS
jgi:hypothetical protein